MLKTLLLILVANIAIFGHEQWVHQYLTNQGYQYFKHQNGLTISELENNLGKLIAFYKQKKSKVVENKNKTAVIE